MKLSDMYSVSGKTLEGFKEAILDMENRIQYKAVNLKDIALLNYQHTNEDEQMIFYLVDPDCIFKKSNDISFLHNVRKKKEEFMEKIPEELFKEAMKNEELLLYIEGKIYLVSNHTFLTLSQKINLPGVTNLSGVVRDIAIAQRFKNLKRGFNVKLVTREENGCNKVYAVASPGYKNTPQSILLKILDLYKDLPETGKYEIKQWYVDNFATEIYLEFPELAKDFKQLYNLEGEIIPGIELSTSDTLDCSVTVTGTIRMANMKYAYPLEMMKDRHFGNGTESDVIEKADEEVLAAIRKLPERLVQLVNTNLTPANIDLKKIIGQRKNLACYKKALKYTLKSSGVEKAIGKNRNKMLLEEMLSEINPMEYFTAYDVAMHVMSIPERIELPESSLRNIRKACGRVPYINFEHLEEKETETIMLSA